MLDFFVFGLEVCACFYALTFMQNDVAARENRRIEQRLMIEDKRDERPIPPTAKVEVDEDDDWERVENE